MKIEPIVHPDEFDARGYCVKHNFLQKPECEHFLRLVEDYQQTHDVPHVYRKRHGRSLNYHVIDGEKIKAYLPEVERLYQEINQVVNQTTGRNFSPLKNSQVKVNINITPPGGEYRWHYDRNALTGILYLNEVEGGETECYPNYRIYLEKTRYSRYQQWLDNLLEWKMMRYLFGKQVLIEPRQGNLLLMPGNKCLHSVRPVRGKKDRINIILAYDAPDADFIIERKLDAYLYSQEQEAASDPNYA